MREIFILLVSVGLIATVEATFLAFRFVSDQRAGELKRRLQTLSQGSEGGTILLRDRRFARSAALDAMLQDIPAMHRIDRLLGQADSQLSVAQVLGYGALAGLTGLTLGIMGRLGLLALALAALGAASPFGFLVMARNKRSKRLSEQLPDALDMMSRSLRAGHATISAFRLVATEMPAPAGVEFGRAFEEQKLGLPLERAVFQMTERLPTNGDLKIFAVSTVIQKETGGNLAEILGNLAETIRARYKFFGKLRALTGEARASATVLGALPLLTALAMQVMNPGYLDPLFTDSLGKLILAYCVTSWAVGLTVMHRMTKLDY